VELPNHKIKAPDEHSARQLGSQELGVSLGEVRVERLAPGLYRVQACDLGPGGEGAQAWACTLEEGRLVRPGEVVLERRPTEPGGDTGPLAVDSQAPCSQPQVGPGLVLTASRARAEWLGYTQLTRAGQWSISPLATISKDRTRAHVDLRDPSLTPEEVLEALEQAGVVHGVALEQAWQLFRLRGPLPRPIVAAVWTEPAPAQSDHIEWHVDRCFTSKTSPGAIDFRERGGLCNVTEGDLLATCRRKGPGVQGRLVDGAHVDPPEPEPARIRAGIGVQQGVLEDGSLTFLANRDGVLLYEDDELTVSDLLIIGGDVDYSTGNLSACVPLLIKGDVQVGFEVSADADVYIEGSVEAGTVECSGKLFVGGAVIGSPDTHVSGAKGVQLSRALNATVHSEGDVTFGSSDTGSEVTCNGKLKACEGPGILRGGLYCATQGVFARELGSPLGAPTIVRAGTTANIRRELATIKLALAEIQRKDRKLLRSSKAGGALHNPKDLSPTAAASVRRLVKAHRSAVGATAALSERQRRLEEALCRGRNATVEVEGDVHAGVEITINDAKLVVESPVRNVRFTYNPEARAVIAHPLRK